MTLKYWYLFIGTKILQEVIKNIVKKTLINIHAYKLIYVETLKMVETSSIGYANTGLDYNSNWDATIDTRLTTSFPTNTRISPC